MNIVLLTCVSGAVFQRALSAYQLSHNCRSHGFTSQVIDFINDFTEEELLSTVKKFVNDDTLCLGLSTSFFNDFKIMVDNKAVLPLYIPPHIQNVCIAIKKLYPNLRMCLGGSKAYQGINIDWVDDIFQGYSEDQFIEYCKLLKNNKTNPFIKKVHNKQIYNTDNKSFDITSLDHRFLKNDCILQNEVLPIEISRGCIFKCKFCAFPLNGKKKLDYIRDFDRIRDELIFNYENYNTTNYFFNDDTLNDSVYKIENLHRIIKSLPFKIEFSAWMRLDLLYKNQETIELLKDMGLRTTFFGIESFNSKALKVIGKSMSTNKTKEFLEELYYKRWNEEISIFLGMIVGLPHESVDDIQQSVNWLAERPFSFHFEPLRLTDAGGDFYKSEFERNYLKYGYTLDDNSEWSTEYMNQKIAQDLATKINTEYAYNKNKLAGSYLFAMLNHFKYEDMKDISISNINHRKLIVTRKKLINNYKTLIKNL
jgi:radical SAM superfamily enzyme YgiQ (UPF0313 family)